MCQFRTKSMRKKCGPVLKNCKKDFVEIGVWHTYSACGKYQVRLRPSILTQLHIYSVFRGYSSDTFSHVSHVTGEVN